MLRWKAGLPLLVLGLCTLAIPSAAGLYNEGDGVVILTEVNFDKLVQQRDGVAVVEFFAPWCGHCKALAPQYTKVATNLAGLALVGAVDCDANKKLCSKYGIRGFPTLKLFGADRLKNPYTGELSKDISDYQGPRTAKPIADAALALLSDVRITRLASNEDWQEFKTKHAGSEAVVLATSKKESTNLYKALSLQLHKQLAFAEVHESVADVVAALGVTDLPSLVVLKEDGSLEPYTGELKAPALLKHLAAYGKAPAEGASAEGSSASGSDGGSKAAGGQQEADDSNVREAGLDKLSALDTEEDMALIALYGGTAAQCSDEVKAFLKAAIDMQEVVPTFRATLTTPEEAEKFAHWGVSARNFTSTPCRPQLVLLPFGKDKKDTADYAVYEGPIEGKPLQTWVTSRIPVYFMSKVDDLNAPYELAPPANMDTAMAAHKVILFTKQDVAPGVYRALAMNLRKRGAGLMSFHWVQVGSETSKSIVEQFKPPKVPSLVIAMIIMSPEDNKPGAKPAGPRIGMQPYYGPLKYTPMYVFLSGAAASLEEAAGLGMDPTRAAQIVPQVTKQSQFESDCAKRSGLCLLAFLDSSSPQHEQNLEQIKRFAASERGEGPIAAFLWFEAQQQRAMMEAFGLMASDVPALVALSPSRFRYAALPRGDEPKVTTMTIRRFIDTVLAGKARVLMLQDLPKVSEEAPDGSAASGPDEDETVEDEFDLEDIMNEPVAAPGLGTAAERLKKIEETYRAQQADEEARRAAERGVKEAQEQQAARLNQEGQGIKKKTNKKKKKKSKKDKTDKQEL